MNAFLTASDAHLLALLSAKRCLLGTARLIGGEGFFTGATLWEIAHIEAVLAWRGVTP